MALAIAAMTAQDLGLALDWAAAEGWNPGIEDAHAFRAADPGGFLMGRIGAEPVAAISAVRHSDDYGFLGLYICRPEYRGQGHGWAMWQSALTLFGARRIGLDGVVAQEDSYRRSGFELAHRSRRWQGVVPGRDHAAFEAVDQGALTEAVALDRRMAGVERPRYATAWFTLSRTRLTLVGRSGGVVVSAGTIRACRGGHKIGPLYAPAPDEALALIETLVARAGAAEISLDAPEPNEAAGPIVERFGLTTVFSCARMYKGAPPQRPLDRVFGEMTFELG